MKAVGMFAQGISSYDAGKFTRATMQTNSRNALNDGVAERDRIRFASRMAIGQQLVDGGGSGTDVGTGSSLDALKGSMINREMDFAVSRRQAGMKSAGFIQQGEMAYAKGKAALAGGIISGAMEIASEVAGAAGGMGGGGGGGEIAPPDMSSDWKVMNTASSGPAFASSDLSSLSFGGL